MAPNKSGQGWSWVLAVLLIQGPAALRADPKSFDCALRSLALEYAQQLQPRLTPQDIQDITDALNGSPEFGNYNCSLSASYHQKTEQFGNYPIPQSAASFAAPRAGGLQYYVDAANGSDSNPGTLAAPFRSISYAISSTRTTPPQARQIYLRQGWYFLAAHDQGAATIVLTPQDSHLTLSAFPGEEVWVSGAAPLPASTAWSKVNASGNVWAATFNHDTFPNGITALRAGTNRLIRARFPNANPEYGFGSSLNPLQWIPPPATPTPVVWTDLSINRTDMNNGPGVQYYTLGVGGGCAHYSPPAGFWCSNVTVRFSGFDAEPRWPSGLTVDASILPHIASYKHVQNAIVHAWRSGHWYTRQHVVGALAPLPGGQFNITFSGGGFQGGEGEDGGNEFYIENVFEELDAPAEWYYDEKTATLSVFWNSTGPPDSSVSVPLLRELVNVTGDQDQPVVNVVISGIGFRDTAPTYLQPHGLPSGGDWALARTGAILLTGVTNVTITNCFFERLDGTAIFISGFSRNTTISHSSFSWLGESAIALWGIGQGAPVAAMGPDLTAGNVPLFTRIESNICREIGIWQKQSSCVFQAEAGLSHIANNIFYNGPRAAINFNEDSIGGSVVEKNIGFNWCRESGDHGVFNSWGRLPYVHDALGTGPTTQKLWDQFTHNLFIANYNAMAALDHDDASAYYNSTFNVFAYSPFGLKSDFGGHDNLASHSVYAYLRDTDWFDGPAAIWITFGSQFVGHQDAFHNNLVVQDWCQGPCNGNISIGQICNASSPVMVGAQKPPPLNTYVSLTLNISHSIAVRHCDFVLYATALGVGLDHDYVFNITASLNGAPSAVSFTAIDFPDRYLTVTADGIEMIAAPNADDASWLFTPLDSLSFTLASLSKTPSLHGALLTMQPNVTGPCTGQSGFNPPDAGDIALNSSSPALVSRQTWSFIVSPLPPPPPGIAVTDVHDNSYFLPASSAASQVFECGMPLTQYQQSCRYCDPGSTAAIGWPEDDVILTAARKALGLPVLDA